MKAIHYVLGILASILMIAVLGVISFEIAVYSDFGWYQKEYEKYQVISDLEMEMSDVMYVTEEMMEYLHGERENLIVETVVAGEEREFFNDREKAHMVDVLKMFLTAFRVRAGAIAAVVILLAVLILTKSDWKRILPRSFLAGTGVVIGITAVLGVIFMNNFNKYFIMFHHLFFDNDLWLLDPDTDLMIRMLPEGFFMDMVARIGIIFLIAISIVLGISIFMVFRKNKSNL